MLGFLSKATKRRLKEERFETCRERAESAFNAALGAEARNNPSAAEHLLRVAIREEEKALTNV